MTVRSERLVGRTGELMSLDRALAALGRLQPSVLALVGEPGIGKTRLLSELGRRADEHGRLVLSGSASELEHELPFGLFVDALDDYVHALEPQRLDALDGDVRAELAQVLPSLTAPAAATATQGGERLLAHRAMRRLLEELAAAKPLVLLLDDLHWADSGSIELLGSLLRRPPAAAVLLALGLRPRQAPERLAGALERAARAGAVTRVELGALSAAEARELVGDAAADEHYAHSGGNPFYLEQLARAPHGAGRSKSDVAIAGVPVPWAVAAALTGEIAALAGAERRLLEGAAVAGDPFELELAAVAAGIWEPDAMTGLDELLRHDLVRTTDVPRRFRFRHPLVRAAVYEAAPAGWRLGAHERSAAALAARGAPAAERVHHVERCARRGDMDAVAVLRAAAGAAAPRAPATAAGLYGAALRLLPQDAAAVERASLLAALAETHAAAGEFDAAHAAMLDSLALLPEDARSARVRLTAACATLETTLGRHRESQARLMDALDALPDVASPETVELTLALSLQEFLRADYEAMRDWTRRAADAARPLGDRALTAAAAASFALASAFTGALDAAEAELARAAELVNALRDEELGVRVHAGSDRRPGAVNCGIEKGPGPPVNAARIRGSAGCAALTAHIDVNAA